MFDISPTKHTLLADYRHIKIGLTLSVYILLELRRVATYFSFKLVIAVEQGIEYTIAYIYKA